MPQYTKTPINELMPSSDSTGWPWRLLIASTLILFIVTSIYFGLEYGFAPTLNSRIRSLNDKLLGLGQEISDSDRESFLNFYSQLVNLKVLLGKHITSSKLFPLLEENTNEGIFYTSLSLDIKNRSFILQGTANNYESLSSFGSTLSKLAEVDQFIFEDMQTSAKGVNFKIRILFKPGFLGGPKKDGG